MKNVKLFLTTKMAPQTRSQTRKMLLQCARNTINSFEYMPDANEFFSPADPPQYYKEFFECDFKLWPNVFRLTPKIETLDFELVMSMLNLRRLIPQSMYNEKSSQYDISFCCIGQHADKRPTTLTLSYEDYFYPNDATEFECKVGKLAEDGNNEIKGIQNSDWFLRKYPDFKLVRIGEIELKRSRIRIGKS